METVRDAAIRNRASLVFNVRFLADGAYYDYLEVGDATWEEMEARYEANFGKLKKSKSI